MRTTTEAKLIWMLILKLVAPVVYRVIPPTMWGAMPGRSPLEATFMQGAVVDMDPISLIITSLDIKAAFSNTPHCLLQAIREHMKLRFQGFLQVYLADRLYTVQTAVGTTPWTHPTSGVLQGGAEGPFLFLLVTLPLAIYIQRTYSSVVPYPIRTTLLAFADDMAVVTATARQPLPDAPDNVRANRGLHDVTNYLDNNRLHVHNVKAATMVHSVPRQPLRAGTAPITPTDNATYLGIQQAATQEWVTLPPDLERQLTRTLVIACIAVLSTQALAYFLQAVLNAAIGFQALHLTHRKHMLQRAVTTVQRAWAIHGHQPTSLFAEVRAASAAYYGDDADHPGHGAYTAHTAKHLHCLAYSQEPEVREVFTLTLREAQHRRNTCPQYILHQQGPPHHSGNSHMEPPTAPAAAPQACHSNEPQMQGGRPHSRPAHRCGPGTDREHHHPQASGQHTTPRESDAQPNAGPPAGGHPLRPLPATAQLAQQITPGEPPSTGGRHGRMPTTERSQNP